MSGRLITIHIFQIVIAITLSGCASIGGDDTGPGDALNDLQLRGTDCILIRTIRDYRPLDSSHMLISGPSRRTYFVTLFRPAFEMRGSIGLSFDSRDDQLCPFGGDAVAFGGLSRERIGIQSISRLSAKEEEEILFRFGLIERAEQKPPEPAIVKGAEVEELD